jgi:hypothetical protein
MTRFRDILILNAHFFNNIFQHLSMQIWFCCIILVVKIMSVNSSLQKTYALTYETSKNNESTIILKESLADCDNLSYKMGKMSAALFHEAPKPLTLGSD